MSNKIKAWMLYLLVLGYIPIALGSTWVNDPNNCPVTFQSQTCSGVTKVCGYSGGVTYCYDPASITPPTGTASSTTDQDGGSINGGYVIDCESYDSTEPHCNNGGSFWCDRNSTCYTTKVRSTTCLANQFGKSNCGACRSGYQDCAGDDVCEVTTGSTNYPTGANNNYGSSCSCQCDANYADCDLGGCGATNGCEQHLGSDSDNCAGGANNHLTACTTCVCDTGYQDCDASGAGSGNGCEVQTGVTSCVTGGGAPGLYGAGCVCNALPKVDIFANIFNQSWGTSYLWGKQTNPSGYLINLSNSSGNRWEVDNTGCIHWMDSTTTCTNPIGTDYSESITWLNMTKGNVGNCPFGQFIQNLTNTSVECYPDLDTNDTIRVDDLYANITSFLLDTNDTLRVDSLNFSKAHVGDCGVGEVIQNITNASIECKIDSALNASYLRNDTDVAFTEIFNTNNASCHIDMVPKGIVLNCTVSYIIINSSGIYGDNQ